MADCHRNDWQYLEIKTWRDSEIKLAIFKFKFGADVILKFATLFSLLNMTN